MKYTLIDLKQNVLKIDGTEAKIIKMEKGEQVAEPFTILTALVNSLNGSFPEEQVQQTQAGIVPGLDIKEKIKRYDIAKKIFSCETQVVLDSDEVSEVKKCINKMYPSPEIVGFLEAFLEGKQHDPGKE